jgi:hypothetical protein
VPKDIELQSKINIDVATLPNVIYIKLSCELKTILDLEKATVLGFT